MKKINVLLVLILGIVLMGFKQQDPAAIIQKVYHDNLKEIMMATFAKDKLSTDELKNYATILIQDHEAMGDELTQFANELSVDLSGIKIDESKMPLDSLQALPAGQIDAWFKAKAIESHEKTISYFNSVIADESVDNEKLKGWMKAKLPNLNSHLMAAQGLKIPEQALNIQQ
ncbi:DUF4142 domain-containing protein [Sphingobacterium sp. SGL-16]|uniref:DUF4142 domain-containing protein n=1 Tax=Sphingobacterium sp. SGL-16 TaxID=2710883 RepID=UPI0013ECAF22|nr:DUF4142 domain-containing protein [Sphingobacterium sp. SGL-16]NGM74607.1 DUF4142 domain-containing protein [Sphingobacterium sp. SGL-16]